MNRKSTIPTLTQKYNDLHALVTRSYADKDEREDVWQSIRKILLNPDDNSIQANIMEFFEDMIELGTPIGHKDFFIRRGSDTTAMQTIIPMIRNGEIDRPWCNFVTRYAPDGEYNRLIFRKKSG
ncbi:MAG: hypothetical protein IKN70_00860 [Fibrobacter sp.]|nr:hypothetical protein [Fibrobacter sp.]